MKVRPLKSAAALGCFAACLIAALPRVSVAQQAPEPSTLVLNNGRSIPLSALAVERGAFVVKTNAGSFNAGQSFPITSASHVSERPVEIDQALGRLLMDQPEEAAKALEPILALHEITAPVPENFWIDAARVAWVAAAWTGDTARTSSLAQEISTIAGGRYKNDPYTRLAETLAKRSNASGDDDRISALGALISDALPDDVNALATYFRAKLLQAAGRNEPALQAYLTAGCVYPAGGLPIVSAAELNASSLLAAADRREEAVTLLTSAVRGDKDGPIGTEAAKRLEALK